MIDSTPTASGAVVDKGTTGTPQTMVEADASRETEEARHDAQPRHGARSVALQGEQVLAGPEDRLGCAGGWGRGGDFPRFVLAPWARHEDAEIGRSRREVRPP